MTHEEWNDAEVQYGDWRGTVQIDDRRIGSDILPEGAVGLDRENWRIVGLHIYGGGGGYDLHVLAVPREPDATDMGDREILATDFLIHDVDPFEILRRIALRFDLRVRDRSLVGRPIVIAHRADIPEQD